MNQDVHGHEILERIVAAGGTLGLPALRDFAVAKHGENARYFTCSANGMSFEELLAFLVQRNKIAVAGELVTVFVDNICQHGEMPHGQSHVH